MRKIAVVRFAGNVLEYEYLMPKTADGTETHAVVKERGGTALKIVRINSVKDTSEQEYTGKLTPLVHAFSMEAYNNEVNALERRAAIQLNLRERLESLSLVAQIKALGIQDTDTQKLIDELEKMDAAD